ncbi:MAG TPA: TonB-dependent receptor [Bacteroidia bacterium]|nr:TonB-dependent receptor [Bacteroidia bacterium]
MLNQKLLLHFFFSFLFISSVSAQETGILKGKITDDVSKEYITGATIRLVNNLTKGTVSDIDGNYSMVLDTGYHQLFCVFVGSLNDTFSVHIQTNQITEKNIDLLTSTKLLETIVVSSGKFDQKLEELTVSMEVIKPALINSKNTTSIETALEQVPGLTIIDNDPQIRGGSGFTFGVGSRVAVVVDGIPLLSGDAGRPEWNYIPVENIEQVEIIKGASSVLYGSSALSGVINVRSAYPRSVPKTVINYSVGNYSLPQSPAENWYNESIPGFTNLNFMHSRIVKKNLDFVIGGNMNVDQGYIGPPPAQTPVPDFAKPEIDTVYTFSNKDMQKVRGRINVNLRYRSKKIPGLSFGVNSNAMLNKTNMVFAWFNDSAGLYKGFPGAVFLEDQTLYNIDPFIRLVKANGITHSLVTRIFRSNNIITGNQSNSGTMCYGEYQLQRIFKNLDFTFTGGVVGNLSQTKAAIYASAGSPENKIVNASGYVQIDKKFWSILNVSGGFRYEYFKMNNLNSVVAPIYRVGASLQVLKYTYVRSSYGQGFRYPTITERYIKTKAGMFGVYPNPNLKPELSTNFEVGLKQAYKIGGVAGYLDIAGFYQKYQNTIEFLFGQWDSTSSFDAGFKFLNTGDSRIRGVDVSLVAGTLDEDNKKYAVTALIGYTYIEPVCLTPDSIYGRDFALGGTGRPLSYKNSSMDTTDNVLKYRFKHMLKADLEFKIKKFNIGFSYRYYSKMQNIDKALEDIETLTAGVTFVDDIKGVHYWKSHYYSVIFDARISYRFNKKMRLSLVCNNIFNVDYSLRPLKIESPRTTALQYVLSF